MVSRLKIAGSLATGTVIGVGMALVIPAFFIAQPVPDVTIYVVSEGDSNAGNWCESLARSGKPVEHLFISGQMAEKNPECVTLFKDSVGSMTYSYTDITSVPYDEAKQQVQKGKDTIDSIANIDSKSFRAPLAIVDGNIYSYLSAAGITDDYSYPDHFNKYYSQSGYFILNKAKIDVVNS